VAFTDRPVALLLHGQPSGPYRFAALRRLLGPDWRVIAPTRPGYGVNPAPPTGFAGNAAAAVRSLDDAGIDRAVVLGHSWGGGIALDLAIHHPDRVSALVLVASVGPGCLTPVDYVLARPRVGAWITRTAYQLGGHWYVERVREHVWAELTEADRADFDRHVRATTERGGGADTFHVEQRALLAELPDLVARLPQITAPTTVIQGTRDRVVPPRTARRLAAAIPHATLRVVQGADHELLGSAAPLLAAEIRAAAASARSVAEPADRRDSSLPCG
jgi:pimeloyl-ACP methyl ester carboxylesterase